MTPADTPDPSAKIAELERRIAALEQLPIDIQVQNKSFTANEGQHCILEAPAAGMTATLPRARPQNRNARITFTLRNSNPVRFIAVNGSVNSRSSGVMAAPGTFDAISDGVTGWYISVLAAGPTATTPPLGADFVVGVANPGLPNARVATASVEITPSIAVVNVISWALNASSVVFAKLQNLTGLSVLGRAANSAGVMAAIAAGGAQQYLRSNTAGTSLEFADPASASIINTGGQFVRAALTGDVTVAQALNVASFRSFAAKSVLANASSIAGVPSDLAGSASFQHLRVNAANSGLEWSLLTAGDFPPNIVPIGAFPLIGADTVLANITAGAAAPAANPLANFAGAGLGFASHAFLVNVGPSMAIVTDNVVRAALTGDVTAAQDSNATAFRSFGAKSVLANATNAAAVPLELAGTVANTYLRVNAANTALEYGALPAGVMPTIQPGSFIGLQITAGGAAAAIEITGKEAGQNIRFDNQVLDTTSSGTVTGFVVASGINVINFNGAAALTLNSIIATSADNGRPILVKTGASGNVTFIHESGSEATQGNRFQTPDTLPFTLRPACQCILVRHTIANGTQRWVVYGVQNTGVQLNAAAVAPVETLNFSDSSRVNVTSSSISGGIASMLFNTITASQLDLDIGTDINKTLISTLLGFRPGVSTSSNTGAVNTAARQVGPSYTVPANTMVVGSCYLLIGYASFIRSTTATALNLITSLTVPGAVPATAGVAASVTISVNRGALVFAFVHCESSGAGGTVRANLGVIGQWGAGGVPTLDFTTNTVAVSINTTIANLMTLGVACSLAVPGAGIFWQNSAVLRIK